MTITAAEDLDTNRIKDWRSIVTLIVFVVTNIVVLFPFHVPVYVPRWLSNGLRDALAVCRVIPWRQDHPRRGYYHRKPEAGYFEVMRLPLNFITAPLIADLFLLAILAIGRDEVRQGTVGADNIYPINIMAFFLTLAYIAISIDASGLIRWLAFKVLQKAGKNGHRLYLYLYLFFFALATFAGNDPVILSGTAFLAYMTRVSSNIEHPRAWIYSQFTVANVASAILVSSNPTNLVIAGAFNIKFIAYTANMIVPVIATAIVLFPFLTYILFPSGKLIPPSIALHELPEDLKLKKPINPNIPHARGGEDGAENEAGAQNISLEEIMNPFLDRGGALFGSVIMVATLVTILALNAASQSGNEHPVYWVTLPAAFVMFCWDIGFGWVHRHDTRNIARKGRERSERARAERELEAEAAQGLRSAVHNKSYAEAVVLDRELTPTEPPEGFPACPDEAIDDERESDIQQRHATHHVLSAIASAGSPAPTTILETTTSPHASLPTSPITASGKPQEVDEKRIDTTLSRRHQQRPRTLQSLIIDVYQWLQETFPTCMAVFAHLPFALIPFALAMFVLVQALVTKGWVPVFAHGWDNWVQKTGTVGAIGGMGFLASVLSNCAGTNIGTSILLCRVVQAWVEINQAAGVVITQRTFWATVYSMALGVNYGAFSTAFSASLAGLLWRDILSRKHIQVRSLDFARTCLPIIAVAMAVGCAVLVGEVYITRDTSPYVA